MKTAKSMKAAKSMKLNIENLGPKRSRSTPTGSCINAAPKNIAAGKLASCPGVKSSSVRRSGAISAGADRKK